MKNHLLKRVLSMILVVALLAGFYVPGANAASTGLSWKESDQEVRLDMSERVVEPYTEQTHAPTELVRVSIILDEKSTVQAGFNTRQIAQNTQAMAYNRQLKGKQDAVAQAISVQALGGQELDVVWNLTLVGNIISANVPYGKISEILQVDGVKDVIVENCYLPCVVEQEDSIAQPQMFASLGMTGSSLVWSSGYTGAGSRIAVIDTGTDTDHQSLNNGAFLYALERNAEAAGLSYEEYVAGLDLLDAAEITSVLGDLNICERVDVSAADLYLNEKLPFAVNYVDRNLVVNHESDGQGEHGSHVAGIATANRYIPQGDSYADALDTVFMAGVAPDAQLITMKVFGNASGPYDSDYMSAVEDAILLGCDAVNLSLGSGMAGDSFHEVYADLLASMTKTDTVVVASCGNSDVWASETSQGYLYSEDVSLDTVGSPGSYSSFLAVASVDNDGGFGSAFRVAGRSILYNENLDYGNSALAALDTSADLSGTEYEYVFIDGYGNSEDYTGMDLTGKVVFCSRGNLNFADKANNAMALGAAAVVIYNNQSGGAFGMNLTGLSYSKPCVSISQEHAAQIRAASASQATSADLTYYTGKMTILGQNVGVRYGSEYYSMSTFSSWGVPGNLSLKPEITAPGGNIYSIYGQTPDGGGTDQYELMSGTSMAAPAVTGAMALMSQYIRENGLDQQEGLHVRTLAQSLLMSTAEPLYEEASGGSYYSLLNQGAGLARVDLATAADSYILVDGQSDGKVKAELGDDPNRTGVYEFSFSIHNLSGKETSYSFCADLFTQDIYTDSNNIHYLNTWTRNLPATATFTVDGLTIGGDGADLEDHDLNGDGVTNAADADYLLEYLLGNESTLHAEGDLNGDTLVTTYDAHILLAKLRSGGTFVSVPANGSVTVDVKLALTGEAKAFLDSYYENGAYVEAFVYAESLSDEEGMAGTVHSIPVLAFYGNWTDPSMFDHGTYIELLHGDMEKLPYLYNLVESGNILTINYGDGDEYLFGGNPYELDDTYMPERNAFNNQGSATIAAQYFTLIRRATDSCLVVSNTDTGEVYLSENLGAITHAYYHVNMGSWQKPKQKLSLGLSLADLPEGTPVDVSLVAVPEYYRNTDGTHNYTSLGEGAYLTTSFVIDNTAPQILDMEMVDTTLTVTTKDNEYVAAVVLMSSADTVITYGKPVQTAAEQTVSVNLDLSNVFCKDFLLAVYDYAGNVSTYEFTLEVPGLERPYFTTIDRTNANNDGSVNYVGFEADGSLFTLAPTSGRAVARAMEYVEGAVFEISNDNKLYVGLDSDLYSFRYLCDLDPAGEREIVGFNDLAYNKADGKLYGLFYSQLNDLAVPYLCTIDLYTGEMTVLGQMPIDANSLAIDGEGHFYSTVYDASELHRYSADVAETGTTTLVGDLGGYATTTINAMAWDHNTDELYWACTSGESTNLLKVDPATASVSLVAAFDFNACGLYMAYEVENDIFAPSDTVISVQLPSTCTTFTKQSTTLAAQVLPWNIIDSSVTWSSANTSIATVDQSGTVTGVAEGTTTITATSKLDPTKSASCVVTVETLGSELKALVWDEEGTVWWSKFNTGSLPSYTQLAAVGDNLPFAVTAAAGNTLYAATLDASVGTSDLYTVDPVTFEHTLVGSSSIAYCDLVYGSGTGYLFAPYFNYIALVDPATGDYIGAWDWGEGVAADLVGMTYYGSEYNTYYDAYMDYFLILDANGDVYLDAFLINSTVSGYFDGPTNGFVANIGQAVDYSYFQGFHYDGEYTYWTRFNEADNEVELRIWDSDNTGNVYSMGTFPEGVWPVGGLYADSEISTAGVLSSSVQQDSLYSDALLTEVAAVMSVSQPAGSLNAASAALVIPQSSGEFDINAQEITVQLTPASDVPNGKMTVTYDPDKLVLYEVSGTTEAFAYTAGDGTVTVAFACASTMGQDQTVATLTFGLLEHGEHTVTVTHAEAGDESIDKEEILTITSICSHDYRDVVTEPTCSEQGYTTYTCPICGDSYVSDYTDPVDHVYEDGSCKWCGKEEYIVQWKGGDTSLKGTIDMGVYVVLSDNLVNDPSTFVRFTWAAKTVDVPMADAVENIKNGVLRYKFTINMYAKEMTDIVTFQVYTDQGPIGEAKTYSIQQYCINMLNKNPTEAYATMYKAMLNYGTAAQMRFDYHTERLANEGLDDADKVLPENVDVSDYDKSVTGSEAGIRASGATLVLDEAVIIRVNFTLESGYDISDYTFTINGQEVQPRKLSATKWCVETEGISAKDLDDMYEFTCGGITARYGALSYVLSKLDSTDPLDVQMVKALYAYWAAAKALLG